VSRPPFARAALLSSPLWRTHRSLSIHAREYVCSLLLAAADVNVEWPVSRIHDIVCHLRSALLPPTGRPAAILIPPSLAPASVPIWKVSIRHRTAIPESRYTPNRVRLALTSIYYRNRTRVQKKNRNIWPNDRVHNCSIIPQLTAGVSQHSCVAFGSYVVRANISETAGDRGCLLSGAYRKVASAESNDDVTDDVT